MLKNECRFAVRIYTYINEYTYVICLFLQQRYRISIHSTHHRQDYKPTKMLFFKISHAKRKRIISKRKFPKESAFRSQFRAVFTRGMGSVALTASINLKLVNACNSDARKLIRGIKDRDRVILGEVGTTGLEFNKKKTVALYDRVQS